MTLLSQLKTGNPEAIAEQMLKSNPQFKQFVEENKGKSGEQIASEHGIDLNTLKMLMR